MSFNARLFHQRIDTCLSCDQFRLRKQVRAIQQRVKQKKPFTDTLEKLETAITASHATFLERQRNLPKLSYDETLPVVQKRDEIISAIQQHQVVILCGETGSGKTTQLPKLCLEARRGQHGLIGHTQPRRIAARSVASRISDELNAELGTHVGYKIRFSDQTQSDSYIKLMTDGILLAEIQSDPFLTQYDTLIIDEAHERSLNIDFLLGYLSRILPKRRDLKLLITSATIDPERFSKHFGNAPIILAEGRSYPVEVLYRPIEGEDADQRDRDSHQALFDACAELTALGQGDILVFLPGERDIRDHMQSLQEAMKQHRHLRHSEILPLFGRLSASEQNRIFQPHGQHRIILATNVAETSLTVPGIRYVVDLGLARISRYSVRSKVQRLPIEKVSQASANQRKGRCGREGPGVCIRLYSEDDFLNRPEFTEPEILRTNLGSVILQMESMRLGHVEDFPFIERPERRLVNDGYLLLQELQAVDKKNRLTSLGRQLAKLPTDPRLGRMLIAAAREGALDEVLIIASALSIQDPRERPMDKQQAADELHQEFHHDRSDFLAYVNLWRYLQEESDTLSHNQFRKLCKKRFLSYLRIREWRDIHRQLLSSIKSLSLTMNDTPAHYENIHRALLAGLLNNVCMRDEKQHYIGTRNRQVALFPGSGIKRKGANWVMAAEVSETSRLYARTIAIIQPEWVEKLASHLLKRSYHDAHWQKRRKQVGAFEKSTLFGLIINPKKRVNYGPIDPEHSRLLLIREGLVAGQYDTNAPFYTHNLSLVDDIVDLEHKSRRHDILVDPQILEHFYSNIIPEGIYSGPQFEQWRKAEEKKHPKLLFLDKQTLMRHEAEDVSSHAFPDHLECASAVLPLTYHFQPGADDDGVTLTVPVSLLNQIPSERCEWLVPGLLEEKLTALIKALPKALRKNFVPAPDFAKACCRSLTAGDEPLLSAFSTQLQRMTGTSVPDDAWVLHNLPAHLHMRFRIIDQEGEVLSAGRDLLQLRNQYLHHVEENLSSHVDNTFERDDLQRWNFGDLPEQVDVEQNGITMRGYPALAVEGNRIALRLFATAYKAQLSMQEGLLALYKTQYKEDVRYLQRRLPDLKTMALYFSTVGTQKQLAEDIVNAAFLLAFITPYPYPTTQQAFEQNSVTGKQALHTTANHLSDHCLRSLEGYRHVQRRMSNNVSLAWIEAITDIKDQLAHLFYVGFISDTPEQWLKRIPVYMKAIDKRLDALDRSPEKDRLRRAELLPLWESFKLLPQYRDNDIEFHTYWLELRWIFEEMRISLFAQELGTKVKCSIPRIEKQLADLKKRLK